MDEAIVFDTGTAMVRAGVAGEDAPRSVLQNICGKVKPNNVGYKTTNNNLLRDPLKNYVGVDVMSQREEILDLVYPMENGMISNWDIMEKIWMHTLFDELKLADDTKVLHSEAIGNPKANREKIVESMFETFRYSLFCN